MQHESSVTHRNNLQSGLTIRWSRTNGESGDRNWTVVCYSDDSRWLFDNSSAEQLTIIGEVSDGLNKAEIMETSIGAIIALYGDGPQAFENRDAWIESLPESDKDEALALLAVHEFLGEQQICWAKPGTSRHTSNFYGHTHVCEFTRSELVRLITDACDDWTYEDDDGFHNPDATRTIETIIGDMTLDKPE